MRRSSTVRAIAAGVGVCALGLIGAADAHADRSEGRQHDRRPPVYQRRAFDWMGGHHGRHHRHWHQPPIWSPPISAGWFQRPYPYHLDYYRMRYGGSYAPYFGNLYGPPEVVTAPPYYGSYYGEYMEPNGLPYANGGMRTEYQRQESPLMTSAAPSNGNYRTPNGADGNESSESSP